VASPRENAEAASLLSRLPRNAIANILASAIPLLITVFVTPILLRTLGPAGLGAYLLAMSVAGVGALLDLGLTPAAVMQLAEASGRQSPMAAAKVLNVLLSARAVLAALIALVGIASTPLITRSVLSIPSSLIPETEFMLRILLIGAGLSVLAGTLAAVPRAAAQYDVCALVSISTSAVSAASVVIAMKLGGGLRALAIIEACASALQLLLFAVIVRRLMPHWLPRPQADSEILSKLTKLGSAFSLGTVASIVLLHGPRMVLSRTLGLSFVTHYSVPWNMTFRLTQLAYAGIETTFPVAARLSASGEMQAVRLLYARATLGVFVIGCSVCIPLFMVAPELLLVWLGSEFAENAAPVLRILAVGSVLHSLAIVPYFLLCAAKGATRANLVILGGSVLCTGLLAMATNHGLASCVAALCGGLLVQLVVLATLACSVTGLPLGSLVKPLVKPCAFAVTALLVGWMADAVAVRPWTRLIVTGALVGGVFQGLLYLSGISQTLVDLVWPSRARREA
jgi:O-antigen/teichoic acid export membrane protein